MAPKTAAERKRAQRQRDRLRLGDEEYKRIERDKMRAYRASKRPPKPPPPAQPQAQAVQQVQQVQPPAQQNRKKTTKAPQQLQRAPLQVVKDYVPMYQKSNATPISDNSISTYLSQFKKVYQHFTKSNVPTKLKDELTKVLQLKKYDNKYVTKELKFISDTIKFINELKLRYPNPNSYKSHLNSIVAIIGRIKEMNNIYQSLAPVNTGLAKSYSDDRDNNTVSVKDNKRIINFEPKNIKATLKSITDINQKAIFSVYTLQPPRRLEDFAAMKITTETDPQKLRNKNNNYLIIDHNDNPSQFIYNKYKTYKTFGQQVIDINKDLADILKQYIKTYKLKENNYLFGLSTDPSKRQSESNFSKLVSGIFTKLYKSSISITNKWVRVSFATYLNTLNLTIKQRKDYAYKMGHSLTTNMQYGKNMINIDDID